MDDGVVQWEVEGVEGEREGEVSRLQRRSRARNVVLRDIEFTHQMK